MKEFALPKQLEPVAPVHSYLKELHEKHGLEVYPVDPYVAVYKIRDNVWAMFAPCTHGVGDNWLYLVEGPERALFIDNGYGIGNLRGLGEQLTGKPVITAVTHAHGDHAGGTPQWEEVYCHKYCAEMLELRKADYANWWNRFNRVGEKQHRLYYVPEDVIPYQEYKTIGLENHAIINLGGDYDLEVIHMGGHAPGLCCFLDKKSRILYSGDAAFLSTVKGLGVGLNEADPNAVHPECMGISYYSKQIAALAKRMDEFDTVMPGHGVIDCPPVIVEHLANAVKAVIADPYCYDGSIERHIGKVCYKSGGLADIMYRPEVVIANLEAYPLD